MAEKILIVDDDMETLRLVGLMLQRQGYQIVAAQNGTQALGLARNEKPDLIVLDVMMPDVDGYEVTRQLRKDDDTAATPIILFTAKSQVEDKVTGYEVGADDYLTKPIHPAELVAHIKALLARGKTRAVGAPEQQHGYTLAVMSCKGGLGVSSTVLNLALSYRLKTKADVIAAELRPGEGTWGIELALQNPNGLENLLKLKPAEITPTRVEKELMRMNEGVRLLLASTDIPDKDVLGCDDRLEMIVRSLAASSPFVILDVGTPTLFGFDNIIDHVQEVLLVVDAQPATVQRTKLLIDNLIARGFGKSKLLTVALLNRMRVDVQLSLTQVQESLKQTVAQMIPPVPELSYQAALRTVPLLEVQPDGLYAQQMSHLADIFIQHLGK
ncbi:MAG TPA: response regulator [Longilinea sp.]|nr:response regulator [Longilinea sp.]